MFVISSCTTLKIQDPSINFNKICVTGTGRGRLEFLTNKYPFTYESEIDRKKQEFVLAFDFPIVGEKKMALSLDSEKIAKKINQSQIVRMLERQVDERSDKDVIIQSVQEFLKLTSEFVQLRSINKYSNIYEPSNINDHFILKRQSGDFRFEIDSYSLNDNFFERVLLKVFANKSTQSDPILSLYLVPETCEK